MEHPSHAADEHVDATDRIATRRVRARCSTAARTTSSAKPVRLATSGTLRAPSSMAAKTALKGR